MLRIQRQPRSRDVVLTLPTNPSFWSLRPLWVGIGIALALHLGAILLFRFPVLKVTDLEPPSVAVVEIEPQDSRKATTAHWLPHAAHQLLPVELLLPEPARPSSPGWEPFELSREIDHPWTALALPSFQQLERLDPPLELVSVPGQTKHAIKVNVSGPLAQYPLIEHAASEISGISTEDSFRYSVRVDAETGKVCWFTPLASHSSMAEKILQGLRFHIHDQNILPMGEIEVRYD